MVFTLSDIYIGNYSLTQSFGARPEVYSARYNLRGHNGIDISCPTMTPIISAANGFVSELGFDAGGYGNYVKVVHQGFFTLYAHLNDIQVKMQQKVVRGQLLGHSDDSGFSDAPHLHFGVAPCDAAGRKTEGTNGFSGYIDPMGSRCKWEITNPSSPVVPSEAQASETMSIEKQVFVDMVTKSTNWDEVATYFELTAVEKITPHMGRSRIVVQIEELKKQLREATEALSKLQNNNTVNTVVTVEKQVNELSETQKTNIVTGLLLALKNYMFVK